MAAPSREQSRGEQGSQDPLGHAAVDSPIEDSKPGSQTGNAVPGHPIAATACTATPTESVTTNAAMSPDTHGMALFVCEQRLVAQGAAYDSTR